MPLPILGSQVGWAEPDELDHGRIVNEKRTLFVRNDHAVQGGPQGSLENLLLPLKISR